jgi:hypothetical protein
MTGARQALRRLLLVAAAVALLGHGGVELAPRLTSAGLSVSAASAGTPAAGRPASSRPAAESQPVQRGTTLRSALAAAVVPSGGAEPAAGPGSTPLVAPHLVARPVVRPPTEDLVPDAGGAAGSRAPPGQAGT